MYCPISSTASTRPICRAPGRTGARAIGLSLVKELVDLLGWYAVGNQSARRWDNVFNLTLPVQLVQATDPVSAVQMAAYATSVAIPLLATRPSPPLPRASLNAKAINPCLLIVEDNDELREFLVGELTPFYQVIQAADGVEGWAMVQAELPDLVLTDVMMPGMDGHQLTHSIKTHAETDHIAVVMLTAKSNQQSRIEGLRQGADDYLSKPFSVAELHLRLHNLISPTAETGRALPPAVCPAHCRIYRIGSQESRRNGSFSDPGFRGCSISTWTTLRLA